LVTDEPGLGMRYVFLSFSMLSYASLLGPAFLHLWIYAGSGNANFFYAITLVYSLAQIILVSDALYAMVRVDWEKHEGKDSITKGGKVVQI
jgi:GPI-anchor transamidase subunit U